MKTSKNIILNFLMNGICKSTSLTEAVQLVTMTEFIFALGYMIHGSYVCATASSDQKIHGMLYLLSGIIFLILTWLLWITTQKPTLVRCRVWITCSFLNQLIIILVALTRTLEIGSEKLWSSNIWIICGIFLQFYMTIVVWSYMLNLQTGTIHNVLQSPKSNPGIGNEEVSVVSTEDSSMIERNSTVISL